MKTLILLLLSTMAYGQLEVTEPTKSTVLYQQSTDLILVRFDEDTTRSFYTLYYTNAKYKYITDIKFLSFSDSLEVNQFLELSLDVIANGKGYETSKYTLRKYKKSVCISNKDGSYFYLSEKYLLKLQLIKK